MTVTQCVSKSALAKAEAEPRAVRGWRFPADSHFFSLIVMMKSWWHLTGI